MKYLTLFFFLIGTGLLAQTEPDTQKYCLTDDNIGLGGYDPLAYFHQKEAISGKEDIKAEYDEVIYLFSNTENKRTFLLAPEKYLPQFGGWCSMTLVMGRATTPKYDNFMVKDGKLFLFERTLSVNGKELWNKAPEKNEKTASVNYHKYSTTGKIN